jgi:hypothetical protein
VPLALLCESRSNRDSAAGCRDESLDNGKLTRVAVFGPQPRIEYGISGVADCALGYGWAGDGWGRMRMEWSGVARATQRPT